MLNFFKLRCFFICHLGSILFFSAPRVPGPAHLRLLFVFVVVHSCLQKTDDRSASPTAKCSEGELIIKCTNVMKNYPQC